MLPLVLLLAAADPSPSLQAIVALGKGAPADAKHEDVAPANDAANDVKATTPHATPVTPTMHAAPTPIATKKDEPTPWPGVLGLGVLVAGAAYVVWKKKQTSTTTRLLTLKDAVAVGKGRSLLVADVGGRRVLLASSEAGIALLLDLGTAPKETTLADVARQADADATDFARALADEVRLPTAASAGVSVDIEGQEIQRRLEKARAA